MFAAGTIRETRMQKLPLLMAMLLFSVLAGCESIAHPTPEQQAHNQLFLSNRVGTY